MQIPIQLLRRYDSLLQVPISHSAFLSSAAQLSTADYVVICLPFGRLFGRVCCRRLQWALLALSRPQQRPLAPHLPATLDSLLSALYNVCSVDLGRSSVLDSRSHHELLRLLAANQTWARRGIALPAPPVVDCLEWLKSIPPEPLKHAVKQCVQWIRFRRTSPWSQRGDCRLTTKV
jgi:hypothetical protein